MPKTSPTLFVFSGLPGVGKTTLSKQHAEAARAVYLRVDTIETAILNSALKFTSVEDAGYLAAYQLARDNLKLGLNVVADSVNPVSETREAWAEIARATGGEKIEIEVVCTDKAEYRKRIETRTTDLPGQDLPSWEDVQTRDYEPRSDERIIIDTAGKTPSQSFEELSRLIQNHAP